MSHSLNSLKGVIQGIILYRGVLYGLLRGILGLQTTAHIANFSGFFLMQPEAPGCEAFREESLGVGGLEFRV